MNLAESMLIPPQSYNTLTFGHVGDEPLHHMWQCLLTKHSVLN